MHVITNLLIYRNLYYNHRAGALVTHWWNHQTEARREKTLTPNLNCWSRTRNLSARICVVIRGSQWGGAAGDLDEVAVAVVRCLHTPMTVEPWPTIAVNEVFFLITQLWSFLPQNKSITIGPWLGTVARAFVAASHNRLIDRYWNSHFFRGFFVELWLKSVTTQSLREGILAKLLRYIPRWRTRTMHGELNL